MLVFNVVKEQAWNPKKHVEKILGEVEDGAQMVVGDRVEVPTYIDVEHPVLLSHRDGAVELPQRIMSRASRPEAV